MMTDRSIIPAILVNLSANGGRSRKLWQKISSKILPSFPPNLKIITYEIPFDISKCLDALINNHGINCFISAGGDGSVNWIINSLIALKGDQLQKFFIGGIGLGSSNDFLKPKTRTIDGVPARINLDDTQLVDIVKVTYLNEDNHITTRYFLVNASLGVTATANLLFNKEDKIIHYLKPRFVNLAILYTALKTILTFQNITAKLQYDNIENEIILSNIAILKNPHVSGNFKFDQLVQLDDGQMGLNLCIAMNKLELIRTLIDLSKGRFSGKRNRLSIYTKRVHLDLPNLVALEMDGEVDLANNMEFSLIPHSINLLR